MKKIALCALFGAILCANEGANELLVTKSFTLLETLKPQFLFANIRIQSSEKLRNIGELSEKNRGAITKTLNGVISEAKKGEICKGGGYEISPIISYKDNSRRTIGQNVEFALNCKFRAENLADYNALLAKIERAVSANSLLTLPQPRIDSRITQDEIYAKKEAMFGEFLTQSEKIAALYGKNLQKKCADSADSRFRVSFTNSPQFAFESRFTLESTQIHKV